MEMSQLYDEDLLENTFFQQFCDVCSSLFESAVQNEWLICVPKVGTFETHTLTELDFMSHVLIEVSASQYKTPSDKYVTVKDRVIFRGEGFDNGANVQVLFSETFYTDTRKKYQVWCIDKPLSFECCLPSSSSQAQYSEFQILSVDDSVGLLFSGQNCPLKKTFDRLIATHRPALRYFDGATSGLRHLIDTMHSLFTKCLQASFKDGTLKRRMGLNRHNANNVRISVETYINHRLYSELFKYICTAVASEDAELNKINRNLSQVRREDFGIVSKFSLNLPRARRELLTFASFSTPLAKMASVKRVIVALMRSPQNSEEIEPLTADDLIPMLVFLIIRSSIPTWMANFEYMTQFHFSKSSLDDYSFYLSTLEAALFYIKSGEPTKLLTTGQNYSAIVGASRSSSPRLKTSVPPIDMLFESIKDDDMDSVKAVLESEDDAGKVSSYKMCHPLCSCDNCEKKRDDEGANPRSRVTVFSRDDRGYTALHQASLFGHPAIIEYLKASGSVVNATDYHSSTPLHTACQRGHQGAVMMLIDVGADVNAIDNDGNRPLHMAAVNGHENCIKALLHQPIPDMLDINAANENGDTALHLAAKWSYESITMLLLEHGAWPEARNKRNATPMMLVSHGGIVTLLTQAIESAQEKANDGFIEITKPNTPPPPPFIASEILQSNNSKFPVSLTSPVKVSKKVKKFFSAVSDCDINMIKHLMGWLEPEYDSSDVSDDGAADKELCHPLCQCKRCAPTQKIQASLVDVNAADEQGKTALHIAAERSSLEITKMLLEKHAEVNSKTSLVQFTPLHIACQQLTPDIELVKALLEHDAKVNCKDCNGRTPLHFCSQTGSTLVTDLLLKFGANTNAPNIRGNTPLHEASKVNNTDVVKLLLERGANPTLNNKNGLSPMQLTSDSRIRLMASSALDKWRSRERKPTLDEYLATEAGPDRVSTTQHSQSLKKDMFAALEADDAPRLEKLISSISTFNRRSLRHTVTRDRSAPLLNIVAITEAKNSLHISSSMHTDRLPPELASLAEDVDCGATGICTQMTAQDLIYTGTASLPEESSLSATAVHGPPSADKADEHPECDLYLQQVLNEDCGVYTEHSGTESADEHAD